jgi:hypothetical protein
VSDEEGGCGVQRRSDLGVFGFSEGVTVYI